MRPTITLILLLVCLVAGVTGGPWTPRAVTQPSSGSSLQPNSLCAKDERIIFSCLLRRPAKIVSVCASKDLEKERGYLQYRFGLAGKVELEFPKDRNKTQEKFQYTHYMRALVDLTEINFEIDGYNYSVFDDYNAEEKPAFSRQGVTINRPGTGQKEVSYACRAKPKADFSDLQAVLPSERE